MDIANFVWHSRNFKPNVDIEKFTGLSVTKSRALAHQRQNKQKAELDLADPI